MSTIISKYNTTRLGTRPYSKEGFIITRSMSDKMDKILKNYEILILCAPAYSYYDKTLIERRHSSLTSWRAPVSCYLRYLKSHSKGAFLLICLKLRNYVGSECILIIYKFECNWISSFVFLNKFHKLFAQPS